MARRRSDRTDERPAGSPPDGGVEMEASARRGDATDLGGKPVGTQRLESPTSGSSAGALQAVPVERVATLMVDHQEAGQLPRRQRVEEPDGLHAVAARGQAVDLDRRDRRRSQPSSSTSTVAVGVAAGQDLVDLQGDERETIASPSPPIGRPREVASTRPRTTRSDAGPGRRDHRKSYRWRRGRDGTTLAPGSRRPTRPPTDRRARAQGDEGAERDGARTGTRSRRGRRGQLSPSASLNDRVRPSRLATSVAERALGGCC